MQNKTFSLEGREYIELKNLIKMMGYVMSGGEGKIIIQNGEVKVNGEIETRRGKKLRVSDHIEIQKDHIQITV